ncbi:MAG TPA: hypothetical protein VIK91_00330 [Nannocystis sp.]
MRSFALVTLTVALGTAACNDQDKVAASATDTTTTGAPDTTAPEIPDTTTGSVPDPTTSTTAPMEPTTGPGTTTTGDETTTTTTGATTAPDTTTTEEPETTGEPANPENDPYESCSNDLDIECKGDAVCVDPVSTQGAVSGSYCAPKCAGGAESCAQPEDIGPNTTAICAFDSNGDQMADICALVCNLDADDCNNGTVCEDIGIPEMNVNGMILKFGVCTHPAMP